MIFWIIVIAAICGGVLAFFNSGRVSDVPGGCLNGAASPRGASSVPCWASSW